MFRDSKRSESKISSFKTQKEAQEWLNFGVNYEIKTTNKKALDKEVLYFDVGTGRGIGVEKSNRLYRKFTSS